mmetsp:Transcript_1507/g.2072  ORF Transcript_1507/g.2072 Transcript_1507/m.2072 type:complete len:449 (-) Transcript_1507:229-1575(-)
MGRSKAEAGKKIVKQNRHPDLAQIRKKEDSDIRLTKDEISALIATSKATESSKKRKRDCAKKRYQENKEKLETLEARVLELHDELDKLKRQRRHLKSCERCALHGSSGERVGTHGANSGACEGEISLSSQPSLFYGGESLMAHSSSRFLQYQDSVRTHAEIARARRMRTSQILKAASLALGVEGGLEESGDCTLSSANQGGSQAAQHDEQKLEDLADQLVRSYESKYAEANFLFAAARTHTNLSTPYLLVQLLLCAGREELSNSETMLGKIAAEIKLSSQQIDALNSLRNPARIELSRRISNLQELDIASRCLFGSRSNEATSSFSTAALALRAILSRYPPLETEDNARESLPAVKSEIKEDKTRLQLSRPNSEKSFGIPPLTKTSPEALLKDWQECMAKAADIFTEHQVAGICSYELQNNVVADIIRSHTVSLPTPSSSLHLPPDRQ